MLRRCAWAVALCLASVTAEAADAFQLQVSGFPDKGRIPVQLTCEGKDTSPALQWSGVPAGTKSLVLIVDDPDGNNWVHWLVHGIPPDAKGFPEGGVPPGAKEGANTWGKMRWGGPCPPSGEHRYFFRLYALSAPLSDLGKATKEEVAKAMGGHVLATAEYMGTYRKAKKR